MTKYNIWTDLFHYGVVYGSLLLTWPYVMTNTQNNIVTTSLIVFGVFIMADKAAHSFVLGEKA
jgi:hypothetical protein